jgi:hypothetical protein
MPSRRTSKGINVVRIIHNCAQHGNKSPVKPRPNQEVVFCSGCNKHYRYKRD